MCGRYQMGLRDDELERRFQAHFKREEFGTVEQASLRPRYNAAPSQYLPILLSEDADHLVLGLWGFRPEWARGRKDVRSMINARAETVASKPFFRDSFRRRRCLVPATGFFEWQQTAHGNIPFRIYLKGEVPFAFAGLYATITDPSGAARPAYAIITTKANERMAPLHDRMPVILRRNDERRWLDPALPPGDARSLLVPYAADEVEIYRVSERVNSPRNDTPDVSLPVEGPTA